MLHISKAKIFFFFFLVFFSYVHLTHAAVTVTTQFVPGTHICKNGTYSIPFYASGGTGPYTWSISAGTPPTGMTINSSTGVLSGTVTAAGNSSFTVQAVDSLSVVGTLAQVIQADASANCLTNTPAPTLASGSTLSVTSPNPTVTSLDVSSYFSGTVDYLSIVSQPSQGTITLGTYPTVFYTPNVGASGSDSFQVNASNAGGTSATQTINVSVTSLIAITTTTLNALQVGTSFSQTPTTSGGSGTKTFSISAGTLPGGLTLNTTTGEITGTPNTSGAYSFTLQVSDTSGTDTQAYSGSVSVATIAITTTTLNALQVGTSFSQTLATSGGSGTKTFSVSAGTLPGGLSLNSTTGEITGTPTTAGAYSSFTIQVSDTSGSDTQVFVAGSVSPATIGLSITTPSLAPIIAGTPVNQPITTTGGAAPITFSVSTGILPAGLSLNPNTGIISGVPATAGAYNFTIQAKDDNNVTVTQQYTGTVNSGATITTSTLPTPVLGQPYTQTITVSGTSGPVTYSIIAGALPTGLSLNRSTGVISGTPTTPSAYSFTVKIQDDNGSTTKTYTLVIAARPNPIKDSTVSNTINSQVAASQHFSQAQIFNVATHIVELHQQFSPNMSNFSKNLNFQGVNVGNIFNDDPASGLVNVMTQVALINGATNSPNKPKPNPVNTNQDSAPTNKMKQAISETKTALWISGTLNYGSLVVGSQKNKFFTQGITLGIDHKLSKNFIGGAAVGYGFDRTKMDNFGTRSNSRNVSFSFYGSYRYAKAYFIDGLLGYGKLSSNNHRWITDDKVIAQGDRKGKNLFGYLALTGEFKEGARTIAPFIQLKLTSLQLII